MSKNTNTMRVWWKSRFSNRLNMHIPIENEIEGKKILDVLLAYDMLQYRHSRTGYENIGGIEIFENGEWRDWYIDDENGYYDDIEEYLKEVMGIEDNSIYEINMIDLKEY